MPTMTPSGQRITAGIDKLRVGAVRNQATPWWLARCGVCHAVAAPKGQAGAWEVCDPGKLEGLPDLSRHGCKSVGLVGKREYWRCPAGIKSSNNT